MGVLICCPMGRKWIPLDKFEEQMLRDKKWVPYDEHKMMYSDMPPSSLWWCDGDMQERVITVYLQQVARGRAVDQKQLKKDLLGWIQELEERLDVKLYGKRYWRYWMLPHFAKVHGLHPYTFMKRFRMLEKIAKRLFPERVPDDRKAQPVTEELKSRIRRRYLQLKLRVHGYRNAPFTEDETRTFRHKAAMKMLINEVPEIPPFRLGQICRKVRNPKRFPFPRLKKGKDGHYRFPRLK
jgi:hypothetical protein